MNRMFDIVSGQNRLADIQSLLTQYFQELDRDLTFQHIDQELNDLAQKYAAPQGGLLIALTENDCAVGCVAFRRVNSRQCEMKRLFVLPAYRSKQVGQRLVEAVLENARRAGYQEMLLDTLATLKSAVRLYEKYGFTETAPYYDNPLQDVIYLKRAL